MLPLSEDELLIELQQTEPVLRLARLEIDFLEEFANHGHDFRDPLLVGILLRRVLENSLEQKGVPR